MKSKSMILMFVSLGSGLIAAIGISQVMGKNKGSDEPSVKMAPVLVAVDHLDHQSELSEENVKIDHWPANMLPEEVAVELEEIENMVITTRVAAGMPILRADLKPKGHRVTLPIPAGYKVVAIKVPEDDTISGLLQPGDHVDVIGVFKVKEDGENYSVSKTFLKSVQVFSVNNSFHSDRTQLESTGSKRSAILGVLLNERQSERLVLVQKVANLKIALRGQDSEEASESELADLDKELEQYINGPGSSSSRESDDQPEMQQSSRVRRAGWRQRVWNGTDVVDYVYSSDGTLRAEGEDVPFGGGAVPPADSLNENDYEESDSSSDIDSDLEEDQYPGE